MHQTQPVDPDRTQASPAADARVRRAEVRRATGAAAVGNFVEWFDFALYGLLATVLAKVFFPSEDATSSILALFAVFGAAFVARPLGALVFGPLGDRVGRQKVLVVVIVTMSLATFVVGILPARESAGAWVTVALVSLRLLQGFSAGGEIGGANTFLAEYAEPGRRAYRVSFTAASSFAAISTAAALVLVLHSVLTSEAMTSWGWRVPFLLAGPMGLVGLYIRLRLKESPSFRALEVEDDTAQSPLREILRRHWKEVLQSIGLVCMLFVAVYVVTAYMATYLVREMQLSQTTATLSTVIAVVVGALLTPVFGHLADRYGRKPLMLVGCTGFAVLGYPMFAALTPGEVVPAIIVHVLAASMLAVLMAPSNVLMTELFSTRVRYSGASIGYNVGGALFGGTAPYLATLLVAAVGATAPAFVLMVAAIVTAATVLTIPETARMSFGSSRAKPAVGPPDRTVDPLPDDAADVAPQVFTWPQEQRNQK